MLDDLLIALRSVENARRVGVSCSIDPTTSGRQALNRYLSRQGRFRPSMVREIEQVMGPQQITITGVPAESHFARVLVASDYRMKRYAMHFEPAPLKGMPSFLEMMKARNERLDEHDAAVVAGLRLPAAWHGLKMVWAGSCAAKV